jgi:hypothetical protein
MHDKLNYYNFEFDIEHKVCAAKEMSGNQQWHIGKELRRLCNRSAFLIANGAARILWRPATKR